MPNLAVAETAKRLQAGGFKELDESQAWPQIDPGGYYVIRGGSILAWRKGQGSVVEKGVRLIGAHTDSPNLRIKPRPARISQGMVTLGVETYGGVLWHTWLDRDLSIAGRLWIDAGTTVESLDVMVDKPLLRIPNLAIHLSRNVNKDGPKFNPQNHLVPLVALSENGDKPFDERTFFTSCFELDIDPRSISGWDLGLHEHTTPLLSGLSDSFVHAPRLDNLGSVHAALCALLAADQNAEHTQMIACYDHEECGSQSAAGAQSHFLQSVLERFVDSEKQAENFSRMIARSFLVSADMAHALHPNYVEKHDAQHTPILGAGPVIKVNVNQRYATEGLGTALFKKWGRDADVNVQEYVHRTDLPCGTTIGPISAAKLGIRTVDVGNPMLSMHSAREMAASADVPKMIAVMKAFFDDSEMI